jgi:hypothetical protein
VTNRRIDAKGTETVWKPMNYPDIHVGDAKTNQNKQSRVASSYADRSQLRPNQVLRKGDCQNAGEILHLPNDVALGVVPPDTRVSSLQSNAIFAIETEAG